MPKKEVEPPKCPCCKKPLEKIHATDYQTWIWNRKKGHYENIGDGDCEERCPECNGKSPLGDEFVGDYVTDTSKAPLNSK